MVIQPYTLLEVFSERDISSISGTSKDIKSKQSINLFRQMKNIKTATDNPLLTQPSSSLSLRTQSYSISGPHSHLLENNLNFMAAFARGNFNFTITSLLMLIL